MTSIFVPGRLCLFGEHSDWAGAMRRDDPSIPPGACLISGTDQGISATVRAAPSFEMVSRLPDGTPCQPFAVPLDADALEHAAARHDFFAYAAGAALAVWRRYPCGGIRIEVDATDLPIARGLSSSAAICVLTVRAFNLVHQLGLDVRGEMELAYRGEIAAGSQCGRMDQACAFGRQPVLLGFDGDEMSAEPLTPGGPLHLLIVDLMHGKDTRRILKDLQQCFLGEARPLKENLRAALGPVNRDIVNAARQAITAGDAATLGALMTRAQQVFDLWVAPASIADLRAPRLHAVLGLAPAGELVWGGKGVGSQGDGCAQFICRGPQERRELIRQINASGLGRCLPLTL